MSDALLKLSPSGGIVLEVKVPKSCDAVILAFQNKDGHWIVEGGIHRPYEVSHALVHKLVADRGAKAVKAIPFRESECVMILEELKKDAP